MKGAVGYRMHGEMCLHSANLNILRPSKKFEEGIFKYILFNKYHRVFIWNFLEFVFKRLIDK